MNSEYDVENCAWCRGDGNDHGTLGMSLVRDCPRCEGSGRVYVTSRESVTGRRRVYKGPAPRPGVMAAHQQQELSEALVKPKRPASAQKASPRHASRKISKTPKRDARSHAA